MIGQRLIVAIQMTDWFRFKSAANYMLPGQLFQGRLDRQPAPRAITHGTLALQAGAQGAASG